MSEDIRIYNIVDQRERKQYFVETIEKEKDKLCSIDKKNNNTDTIWMEALMTRLV
jgi:hypothetical protein